MLKTLFISNYALIDDLKVEFQPGFSVVTGETGAGKSILLGALGLISGDRLDKSVLRNDQHKMIIEASFVVEAYEVQNLFESLDLDYADETIIRREVNTSGKSRSFVNDTPVKLNELKTLTDQLLHIHAQHETHTLLQPRAQLGFVDDFIEDKALKSEFETDYKEYQQAQEKYTQFKSQLESAQAKADYLSFQSKDIEDSGILEETQTLEEIEQQLEKIENAEEILALSNEVQHLFENDENGGLLNQVKVLQQNAERIARFNADLNEVPDRIKSVLIELEDIYQTIEENSSIDFDVQTADTLREKVNHYNAVLQKYHLKDIEEAQQFFTEIKAQLIQIETGTEQLDQLDKEVEEAKRMAMQSAVKLSEARKKALESITSFVGEELPGLGMPSARLSYQMDDVALSGTGIDQVRLLFSANKGGRLQLLEKVASGGELSRLMLVLQWLWAKHKNLPTVIFDEIDTGVSGHIAEAMANVMTALGTHMQVLTITHLPQVAAKGKVHYLVEKYEEGETTFSRVQKLNRSSRIEVLAQMLSGSQVSEEAKQNAEKLLA